MKTTQMLIQALLALILTGCAGSPLPELTSEAVSVPVAGNTYVTAARDQAKISRRGIDSWEGDEAVLSLWFKVSQTGDLHLFLKSAYDQGEARLQVSCLGKDFPVTINQPEETVYPVGIVQVKQPGYIRVDLKG
ncbi:MAG: DUF5077 domain-containing protein, partial [Tannerellaceae bacterium]|nr:DUF5077 domain-containing protein [Tannerellaceae bacterium]